MRLDSGFFDRKLFEVFEELDVGYICVGKLYPDIKAYAAGGHDCAWSEYKRPDRYPSYRTVRRLTDALAVLNHFDAVTADGLGNTVLAKMPVPAFGRPCRLREGNPFLMACIPIHMNELSLSWEGDKVGDEIDPGNCAQRLRVLSEETRLSVVRALLAGPLHVWEINAELGLDQSLLSHHLRVLRGAGFVTAERDGRAVLYRVAPGVADSRDRIDLGCCALDFE